MSSIRYGTYNVANACVSGAKSDRVLDELIHHRVDMCVLPEVLPADYSVTDTTQRFARAGYAFLSVNNDDADERLDARQTGLAIKQTADISGQPEVVRLQTRNAWHMRHGTSDSHVKMEYFGVHLDDRGNAEREVQIQSLLNHIQPGADVIITGDLNADYLSTPYRPFCRFLGSVTRHIPETQPRKLTGNLPSPGRMRNLSRRLDELTDGTTMQRLVDAGLQDADVLRQPTTTRLGFLRLALDRAMVSSNVVVSDYQVAPQTVSDHSLVSFTATI